MWGHSSVGRAPALQAGGRRFDPVWLHHLLLRYRPSGYMSAIWFTRLLARFLPGTRVPERSGGKREARCGREISNLSLKKKPFCGGLRITACS